MGDIHHHLRHVVHRRGLPQRRLRLQRDRRRIPRIAVQRQARLVVDRQCLRLLRSGHLERVLPRLVPRHEGLLGFHDVDAERRHALPGLADRLSEVVVPGVDVAAGLEHARPGRILLGHLPSGIRHCRATGDDCAHWAAHADRAKALADHAAGLYRHAADPDSGTRGQQSVRPAEIRDTRPQPDIGRRRILERLTAQLAKA